MKENIESYDTNKYIVLSCFSESEYISFLSHYKPNLNTLEGLLVYLTVLDGLSTLVWHNEKRKVPKDEWRLILGNDIFDDICSLLTNQEIKNRAPRNDYDTYLKLPSKPRIIDENLLSVKYEKTKDSLLEIFTSEISKFSSNDLDRMIVNVLDIFKNYKYKSINPSQFQHNNGSANMFSIEAKVNKMLFADYGLE